MILFFTLPDFIEFLPTFAALNRVAPGAILPKRPPKCVACAAPPSGYHLKAHTNAKGKNQFECQKKV